MDLHLAGEPTLLSSFKQWVARGNNAKLLVFFLTFLAYFPELSHRTFNTDYFMESCLATSPTSSFSADNRFLAEALRYYLFHGYVAQFLSLFIGLCLLCISSFYTTELLQVHEKLEGVVASLIITLNPLFIETFSYDNTCVTTPLAILLSTLAVYACIGALSKSKTALGVLLLICSLELYQPSVFVFPILSIALGLILINRGERVGGIIRMLALSLALFLSANVLNQGIIKSEHRWHNKGGERFSSLTEKAKNIQALETNIQREITAVIHFYSHDSFFFGKTGKRLLLGIYCVTFAILATRAFRRPDSCSKTVLLCLLFLSLPVIPNLPFSILDRPEFYNKYRIIFPHAIIMCAIFALGLKAAPRARTAILFFGLLFVGSSILNLNDAHQFMMMKNRYDMDLAKNIVDRLQSNPQFDENLPLVVIGTSKQELPFKRYFALAAPLKNFGFDASNQKSAFAMDWSKDRMLLAYMPINKASESQAAKVMEAAGNRPVWPHPDSVFIENGVMVVMLGH